MNAYCAVSDSGTLPKKNSFYLCIGNPIPVVYIRTATKHPKALEKGDFVLSGMKRLDCFNSWNLPWRRLEMVTSVSGAGQCGYQRVR